MSTPAAAARLLHAVLPSTGDGLPDPDLRRLLHELVQGCCVWISKNPVGDGQRLWLDSIRCSPLQTQELSLSGPRRPQTLKASQVAGP